MRATIPHTGTVYTPQPLARAMVQALGDHPGARWLDPCVGDGAFVRELAAIGIPAERIVALDIAPGRSAHDRLAKTRRHVDFVAWSARARRRFDRIILNPPYVALTRIQGAAREAALALQFGDGQRLGLKANYWCAFLLSCLRVLAPGGELCAVLPAAWDFARYARNLKAHFSKGFADLTILRSNTPLFGDVREGSVVLLARNFQGRGRRLQRIEVDDAEGMTRALGSLRTTPSTGTVIQLSRPAAEDLPRSRLRDLMDIRIGGVTGDASFFLLSEATRKRLELPVHALRRVLTRANHLESPIITKEHWEALKKRGERIWLFRPCPSVLENPSVERYLMLPEEEGGCKRTRYKIANRDPWYQTPLPSRVQGFLSGMSKRGPFLVLNEMDDLSATNTLYVIRFRHASSLEERAALGIALLSTPVRRELDRFARFYADGLLKFEPGELGDVEIPVARTPRGACPIFKRATALLLSGRAAEAQELADAWLSGATSKDLLKPRPTEACPKVMIPPENAPPPTKILFPTPRPSVSLRA